MSALKWQKSFGPYLISVPVAPPGVPKHETPLATIFVEILFQKKIGWGSGLLVATQLKEF